jgi:hypothetical protein
MRLTRRPTRSLVHWLSLALLFMQIATVAYACPAWAADSAAAAVMAEMPGCDGNMRGSLDPDQPQLCKAHCQPASQTVHATPASDAPASPVLIVVLDWRHAALLPAQPAARMSTTSSGGSPPGSPPLYLSLLVLRN